MLKTAQATAEVSRQTGAVRFLDQNGQEVLKERAGSRELNPVVVEDQKGDHRFLATRQVWESPADEAFYGLGQHQQGVMNYKGKDVLLAQHNMDVGIPFVVSSRNYGLLWDTNAITRFGDARPYGMLSDRLIVRDAGGAFGGLTARYYQDGVLKISRPESEVNYEFIRDQQRWPEGFKAQPGAPSRPATWASLARPASMWSGKARSRPRPWPAQVPPLFVGLCEGHHRRQGRRTELASELERLRP